MSTLGEQIARRRQHTGLSQGALARACGVAKMTIWRLEHGHFQEVRSGTLVRLALTLGVSVDFLLGLTAMPDPYPRVPQRLKKK